MTAKVVEPSVTETAFNCPHCHVLTSHEWFVAYGSSVCTRNRTPLILDGQAKEQRLKETAGEPPEFRQALLGYISQVESGEPFLQRIGNGYTVEGEIGNLHISKCFDCGKISLWAHRRLVYPETHLGPEPNPDLPADIRRDYEEASSIVNLSPRGAAALLRLGLQKLCVHLGEKGKNLDDDIASLVAKGLDTLVQRMWDIVRVTGNEAVHPGEMNLQDDPDTVTCLFGLVNLIAEKMISVPTHVNAAYSGLPPSKLAAIEARNAKALGNASGGTQP